MTEQEQQSAFRLWNLIAGLVIVLASESQPAAKRIVAVTNPVDPAVNNGVFAMIVDRWRGAGFSVESLEFPAELNLPHHIMDPRQPDAQTELVYPTLIELIIREEEKS